MKTGVVYRADSLHRLTPTDLELVDQLGVRTVIDMRSSGDIERDGACALIADVAYRHLPWYEDHTRPFELSKRGDPSPDFARGYLDLAIACKVAVAAVFEALAEEEHAIVFHCVAGKGRTGIVAALLLAGLGVSDESIIDDYHLTDGAADRQREWAEKHAADLLAQMDETPEWVLRAPRATMEAFLRLVRDDFGSVAALLAHLGVPATTMNRLRERLIAR